MGLCDLSASQPKCEERDKSAFAVGRLAQNGFAGEEGNDLI